MRKINYKTPGWLRRIGHLFTDQFFNNLFGFTVLIGMAFLSTIMAGMYGGWQGLVPWVGTIIIIIIYESNRLY